MLAVTTADGSLQAVQRVHLTRDAKKAEASPGRLPKHTNGVLRDAVVRLPGDPSRPLLVAEGPETGLSAWATTGCETWVCLGSIATLTPPVGRRLVICRDDDPLWSPGDRKHRETVKTWREQGIDLAVATPWPERRHNGTDLNDTLKDRGADAVRARIKAALKPASGRRRQPKDDARRVLAGGIAQFNAAFDAYENEIAEDTVPPVHTMRVDVALGKTQVALEWAAEKLTEMRARGDQRTFVVAVPMEGRGRLD